MKCEVKPVAGSLCISIGRCTFSPRSMQVYILTSSTIQPRSDPPVSVPIRKRNRNELPAREVRFKRVLIYPLLAAPKALLPPNGLS